MVEGLVILYIGLQMMDFFFNFEWKEFSVGVLFLSITLTILFFLNCKTLGGLFWFLISLIEYFIYLKHIKK